MKKILFIAPSLSKGGAERVVATLSRSLSSEYDVNIAVFSSKRIDYEYEGQLIDLEIPESQNRLIKNFKALRGIKKIKKEIEPDVSVSFLPEPNLINVISRTENEKTIISVRNRLSKILKNFKIPFFISRHIFKREYSKADAIIPNSKGLKRDLIENFDLPENKIKVINNPCPVEGIQEKSEEDLEKEKREIFEKPTIITVGSLTEQKGQWHLIRAFREAKKEIKELNLVIIGEGPLRNYLEELVENLDLEKDVHFLGFKDNPFKYVSRSEVFVLSSLYEGLPNVIIESLACGTPVISTDCKSGPREILAPNTNITKDIKDIEKAEYGILTPTPDGKKRKAKEPLTKEEKTLSKAITQIINNKKMKKKCSEKSKERAKDFKQEKTVNKWKELIGEHYGG